MLLKRWFMSAYELTTGAVPKKAPPPRVLPRTDYRAVSIVPRLPACHAAEQCLGGRILLSDKPRLPLAGCSMSGQCRCKFQMHADRRRTERRSPSVVWPRLKMKGLDRRRATGRRSTDYA